MNISGTGDPRNRPTVNATAAIATIPMLSCRENPASFRVSGVVTVPAAATIRWIPPSCVALPVATTSARAVPRVATVPE